MAPCYILIVMIRSVIPEILVLLTKSEQFGLKSAHIRPTNGLNKYEINKLQRVQNATARVIACLSKFDHKAIL